MTGLLVVLEAPTANTSGGQEGSALDTRQNARQFLIFLPPLHTDPAEEAYFGTFGPENYEIGGFMSQVA